MRHKKHKIFQIKNACRAVAMRRWIGGRPDTEQPYRVSADPPDTDAGQRGAVITFPNPLSISVHPVILICVNLRFLSWRSWRLIFLPFAVNVVCLPGVLY